jgi:ketosteroid isomerase-like protein
VSTVPNLTKRDTIRALFEATDRGELDRVTSYLDENVVVRLSNREPICGATAYAELYGQVAGTLAGLRHEIHDIWSTAEDETVWIVQMTVHYTRVDRHTVSLPCCNILRFSDGRVADYRVFMDMTPVFGHTTT